jgi:serine/threonine protein kinase
MSEDDGQHSRWSVTPRSSINSSTDYAEDSVLEGWLNGEAEEEIMTPMNAFPTTPTITLNGASYTSIANSLLPYVFDPLIPYLYQGNPRLRYTDLTQVAEGQYGPVYSALIPDNEDETHQPSVVAVKLIPVDRKEGSPKIKMIAGELELLHGVTHQNVLATTRLYVDVEDAEADEDDGGPTLWVEMELMERSLADVLPLVEDGLEIPEGVVARLASDVRLLALLVLVGSLTRLNT